MFHHFLANRWGNSGNVIDFIFLGSKVTADGDYSREIKRLLLLGRKAITNLGSILKIKDTTSLTVHQSHICIVKAIVCIFKVIFFSVVMYRCESWTIKRQSAEELMLLNCGAREDS